MNKYKHFACPIYNERSPVIVTDKDTIEALNHVLTAYKLLDDYEIKSEPTSNLIQIHNKHKQLKINWLNTISNSLEEDSYVLDINTKTTSFLNILNCYIGKPFNFEYFKSLFINQCQSQYVTMFMPELNGFNFLSNVVEESIHSNFNKNNHILISIRVINISNVLTTLYKHYEA